MCTAGSLIKDKKIISVILKMAQKLENISELVCFSKRMLLKIDQ